MLANCQSETLNLGHILALGMAPGLLSVKFVLLSSFAFIQMNIALAFYFPNIESSNSHYYIKLFPF